jgi:N-acetylneuraminic acid mutarotase
MLRLINRVPHNRVRSLLVFAFLVLSFSCSESTDDETSSVGNWTKITPFKGRPRSGAICFTIGSKAYVGLGYDGDEYVGDFYVYDLALGYWETKTSFPGTFRERAVSFAIDGKGYVGLGYNREEDKEELGDFWEYDPTSDEWTQLSSFGGTARYNSVAFAIGSKAFVGTGYDGDKHNGDFWEYNVAEDTWNEIASFPGEKIEAGFSFVIGSKGYVAGGRNNGLYSTNFWEFDAETKKWTSRTPDDDEGYYDEFTDAVMRHDAVALTIGDYVYVIGGYSSDGVVENAVYEFDPSTNAWDDRTSFEGAARQQAIGFVLEGRGFVGTGLNGSSRFDDVWEFKPSEEYDDSY